MTGVAFLDAVRLARHAVLQGASWTAWAGAAALLHPRARATASRWAEAVDAADPARVRRAVRWAAWAGAAAVCFIKVCQLRALHLTTDSAVMVNTAANLIAGRGLACTLDGTPSVLSVHFAFLVPLLLGPLLLVARSPLPFVLVQAAAVASCGPAAYHLAERRTGSRFLGLVAMGLAWSHPSFHHLVTADVENSVFVAPLLLWGLVLWDREAYGWACLCALLALATREQFPFSLAGLGVFHALASTRPPRRRWAEGAAVVAGAAVLWGLEMRWVGSYAHALNEGYWRLYKRFGATRAEVITAVLTRPDRVLAAVVWPPSHLTPLARLLAGAAFLPLAAPAAMLLLLVSMFHNLLQTSMYIYLQNAAYSYGPLVFATACGLAAVGRRPWVLPAALAAGGWGLREAPGVIPPGFILSSAPEAPALTCMVPDGASVWTDDFLAATLSARPQLKSFNSAVMRPRFDALLFRPEYVLIDKLTLIDLQPPPDRRRVVGFLAAAGYAKVAEAGTLVLLKDPQAPRPGLSPDLVLPDGAADGAPLDAYVGAVLDSPEARTRLADYPPALRYEPRRAEQAVNFSGVLLERGQPALAERMARSAAQAWPSYVPARRGLAEVLEQRGDIEGASREYEEALRLDPADPLTAGRYANLLLKSGQVGQALRYYDLCLAHDPRNLAVHINRATALLLAGDPGDARVALQEVLRVDPGNVPARRVLAAVDKSRVAGSRR